MKNPFKCQSNSLCIKRKNTCEKDERIGIQQNIAINDACRKQLVMKREINTSRTILQRAHPLKNKETADFNNKQFEQNNKMFFMQEIF